MSTQTSTPAAPRPIGPRDPHRTHRAIVAVGGTLAVVGAALAGFVHPGLAALAAAGGLLLLVFPDRTR